MYPTTFVFDVVPYLDSPSASALPGILLWPETQFRETELLATTSLILLRQSSMVELLILSWISALIAGRLSEKM